MGDAPEPLTVVMVAADGGETLVGRVPAAAIDLSLVDVLARLALIARREGGRLLVRGAPAALRDLLALCGLADVLAVEPGWQPELLEQLGEQEVVQPPDAIP